MGLFTKAKKVIDKMIGNKQYDMSSKESREWTVQRDYDHARACKNETSDKFIELDNYYHNKHYTQKQIQDFVTNKGLNFVPPVLPDPFIQVEAAVDPVVPQFQFKGRDNNQDPARAKEREKVVQYICYNNRLNRLNVENERPLKKLGNAFWKVAYDKDITGPGFAGEITIGNPDPANIFPDPAAYDVDDCEYIIYAYRTHRRKARRIFGGIIDEIPSSASHGNTEIYENRNKNVDDDTLEVVEYWYRDGDGDIACSIQVEGKEAKHIKKYWIKTAASGNKSYPFVKYCEIPVEKSFWDKGILEPIIDLVDASDREFMTAILNDAFVANDIVLSETGAFEDGFEPTNTPGAHWKVKANKINAVKRLTGLAGNPGALDMIQFIHEKIQETTGYYDASQGKEPIRVTTASGIAQLNERADYRKNIKKADRVEGFNRLYELIDWTALEFYTSDRVIMINGESKEEQPKPFTFNSQNHVIREQKTDPLTGQALPVKEYYPRIDSEIISGDGINRSKAFTLQATQELARMPINAQNVGIITSIIDILDLPNKNEIKDSIERALQPQPQGQDIPPELAQYIQQLSPDQQKQVMADIQDFSPEEKAKFMAMPIEEQIQVIQQALGGAAA